MTGSDKRKYKTMTKRTKVHLHLGPKRQTKILNPKHQEERQAALTAKRLMIIQGLPFSNPIQKSWCTLIFL